MRFSPRLKSATQARRTAIEPLEQRELLSASPQLLKDINATGDSAVRYIGQFDGFAYLVADDGTHGIEVWKSDGTEAGTTLLKDIWAGPSGAGDVTGLGAAIGGYFVFSADDGVNGRELWRTDGTPGGTVLLKDIQPGSGGSRPIDFTIVGSMVFFVATSSAGQELWKTDGTPAGTVQVKDILPGPDDSFIDHLTAVGSTLYFSADDGVNGTELWKSDGSAAGTVMVEDIYPFGSSNPWDLTNFGGTLVFTADDGFFGEKLWKVDPGSSDITVLKELPFGSFAPTNFLQVGSTLFFVADTNTSGSELWKTDGTDAGTVQVLDIRPGTESSYPQTLTNVNGTLYFFANDGATGPELWKSNGLAAGTERVKDIRPGSFGSQDSSFFRAAINVNGQLLFSANDGTHSAELWRSDGTTAGTTLVKETSIGPLSGYPRLFANLGGTLLFGALDPNGFQLWKSNGSEAGTQLVKIISTATDGGSGARAFTSVGNKTIFLAGDLEHGGELWVSNGTTAGTQLVKDVNPGTGNSYLNGSLAVVGNVMYFSGTDGVGGVELWRTDGTAGGTYLVKDINPAGSSNPTALTAVGNTLFFTANDGANGPELWKSDGTPAGTALMQDLRPGALGSSPGSLVNVNGTLYFTANDGTTGVEIWKSNGTPGALGLLKDIVPGAPFSSQVALLTNVNGTLFFAASDSSSPELWKSDGTSEGTTVVRSWSDGGPANLSSLTNVNGTLFFAGNRNGIELWKSDGTSEGTVQVKDIAPGGDSSSPTGLIAVGDTLFFFATTNATGTELWKSDGTPDGTQLLKDIRPGSASSVPFFTPSIAPPIAGVADTFYFSANDGTHGSEMWRSDGTPEGTVLVEDIYPGALGSAPARLANVAGSLYFQADDGTTGQEPWIIPGPVIEPPQIVGRRIFYNQSKFDGNSASINAADDNAIATDKVPLQFTGSTTAPISAITSYSRGINGLMIDLPGAAANGVTLADFTFKVGANGTVASWTDAPAPSGFAIRPGAGVGGSDRIVITWANNAIQNTWLQVIVEGNDTLGGHNPNTGLAASDVFFVGNKVGDTFINPQPTVVQTNIADSLVVRNSPGIGQTVTSVLDFNRDGLVHIGDELVARNNPGVLTRGLTWSPPAGPLAEEALVTDPLVGDSGTTEMPTSDVDSSLIDRLAAAVASALAVRLPGEAPGVHARSSQSLAADSAAASRWQAAAVATLLEAEQDLKAPLRIVLGDDGKRCGFDDELFDWRLLE